MVWSAAAAGRAILSGLGAADGTTGLERSLFGFALGLGLLAYAMLLLGLVGGLYPLAGWLLLAGQAALGAKSHAPMGREIAGRFRQGLTLPPWGWAAATVFLLLVLVSFVGVWTPPVVGLGQIGYTEWDSLSYHLADPKIYLQAHRIYELPWESHSNFAFTGEMWYLWALMQRGLDAGIPLAKLFHFACGVGTCLALYAFGARHFSPKVGFLAAGLWASTPLVLWEAGTAYVDLAPAFFGTLTLLAVAGGMAARNARWLRLGAVLMGLTLSTKATSLTTLALLAAGLLFWYIRRQGQPWARAVRAAALWCVLALIVGSPWYIKSAVYTGNPVYPFYSKIFPTRHWNAALGATYDASNASFGLGATLKEVHSPAAAILLPWNLTLYLLPGHPPPNPIFIFPFNNFQAPLVALSPLLLAALFFPAFGRGAPGAVKALGLYALCSFAFWFATVEYVRYLLPALPVFCLLAGWVLSEVWERRWRSRHVLAGLGVCSVAFALWTGAQLIALQAPVVFGRQSRDDYITRGFAPYPAMQFINHQLPPSAKIAFYGNPYGFYCDRAYLWADAQHSAYLPYDTFRTPADLRAALAKIGVTHILVNWRPDNFPRSPGADGEAGWVYALTEGAGPPVFAARGVAVYALPKAGR